jgi:chromate reductase, NAD(P)H dehydrogenase (quinone)
MGSYGEQSGAERDYTLQPEPMITLISGTNRQPSQTGILSRYAASCFVEQSREELGMIDLAVLPEPFLKGQGYQPEDQSEAIRDTQDAWILPARAFYLVVPEYNGSFPGVLKYFLDACTVRAYKDSFNGKKAAILGLSSGRAGNLRGLDHLTGILHYLNVQVMPNRLPVSRVEGLVRDGRLADEASARLVCEHVEEFLQFCS